MLSFIKNRLACNQDVVCLWSLNSNVLASVYIGKKNPSPSLMNIRFYVFLTKYKSTYSTTENPKVFNILSISNPYFF